MFGSEELVLYLGGCLHIVFNKKCQDPTITKHGVNNLLNKKHLLSVISTVI